MNELGLIEFDVAGLPAPQGSKRHVGRGVMVESSKAVAPWRATVAARALEVSRGRTFDGPLRLTVNFRFRMPASRPKRVRSVGVAPKTTAPDLDKLLRAVGDALTESGLIRDDARICEVRATKHEVTGWTGARIRIERLDPADTALAA